MGVTASERLGVPFGIVDLSLAPTPAVGDSVAHILEEIGLEKCGTHGTTAALALLNDAVKNAAVMVVSKEKPENKFNQMVLEDLDLSVRSYNCLKRNGIKTVQDLCNMKEAELMTVRNLGKKSYKEILDKLAGIGLSLQGDDNLKK